MGGLETCEAVDVCEKCYVCEASACFEKDCVKALETAIAELKAAASQSAKDVEADVKKADKIVEDNKAALKKQEKDIEKLKDDKEEQKAEQTAEKATAGKKLMEPQEKKNLSQMKKSAVKISELSLLVGAKITKAM